MIGSNVLQSRRQVGCGPESAACEKRLLWLPCCTEVARSGAAARRARCRAVAIRYSQKASLEIRQVLQSQRITRQELLKMRQPAQMTQDAECQTESEMWLRADCPREEKAVCWRESAGNTESDETAYSREEKNKLIFDDAVLFEEKAEEKVENELMEEKVACRQQRADYTARDETAYSKESLKMRQPVQMTQDVECQTDFEMCLRADYSREEKAICRQESAGNTEPDEATYSMEERNKLVLDDGGLWEEKVEEKVENELKEEKATCRQESAGYTGRDKTAYSMEKMNKLIDADVVVCEEKVEEKVEKECMEEKVMTWQESVAGYTGRDEMACGTEQKHKLIKAYEVERKCLRRIAFFTVEDLSIVATVSWRHAEMIAEAVMEDESLRHFSG